MDRVQRKMKEAFSKRASKKYKNFEFKEGDEVLLYNARKRTRKGARMEPDYSGPYVIRELVGKTAVLMTAKGNILKTKHSVSHLKPYKRRSEAENTKHSARGVEVQERESVIRYIGKVLTETEDQDPSRVFQSPPPKLPRLSPSPPPKLSPSPPPKLSPSQYCRISKSTVQQQG